MEELNEYMKNHIARAMMVSMLEGDHLQRLHEIEQKIGYTLANWNIQELFGLTTIKDRYCLPDDEKIAEHNRRIEDEINRLGLNTTEPAETKLDWIHMFDFNVFHSKEKIIWDYSSNGGKRNIKDLLRIISILIPTILISR